MGDTFSSLAMTYDARNRLRPVANAGTPGPPEVVLTYQYDAVGNVLSVADMIGGVAGAVTTQTYDPLDRVVQIAQSGIGLSPKRVDMAYDANDQLTGIERFTDLTGATAVAHSTMDYDSLLRLTGQAHRDAANAEIAAYALDFDAADRITRITDTDGVHDYSYDNRDQLIEANHSSASNPDETYGFDANGNRTASSLHGTAYETGDANRLLSDGTFNYTYDAEGNLVGRTEIASGNNRELQYDHRNRLVAVLDKNAADTLLQRTEYTYDAFNRRVSRSVDTTPGDAVAAAIEHFVYDREDAAGIRRSRRPGLNPQPSSVASSTVLRSTRCWLKTTARAAFSGI